MVYPSLFFVCNFVFTLNTFLKLFPSGHFSTLFWLHLGPFNPSEDLDWPQTLGHSWPQEKRKWWRVSHWGFLCHILMVVNHQKYWTQIPHLRMVSFRFWRHILTNILLLVPVFLSSFVCSYLWLATVWVPKCLLSVACSAGLQILPPSFNSPDICPGPCYLLTDYPVTIIRLLACLFNSTCSEILHRSVLSTCQVISFLVLNFSR